MTTTHQTTGILLVLFSLATPAFGQELRVTLGQMIVEIGMDQSKVLSEAAAKKQSLTGMPGHDNTAIVWDRELVNKAAQFLGSIVFETGKVKSVFKKWTPEQGPRDVDIGNALFAVASEFVSAGRQACNLTTQIKQEPGQQEQEVSIKCGRRTIAVSTVRNDQHRILTTSVTEQIE